MSRLTETPTSTVHSWKVNGLPTSRLAHIRLVAKEAGKPLPDDLEAWASSRASPASEAA